MAYQSTESRIIPQGITDTSTTQNAPLGTIITAQDSTNGEGEFIYLKGVASTAVGDVVIYDQRAGTTTRTVAGSRGPVAVAMSANVANQYGWYQVSGAAVTKSAAAVAAASVYVTATAGTVDDAVVATDKVDGARFKTADGTPSAGLAVLQLSRPALNGNG
ncbi:hypothetical protein D7X74_30420 [Corallococcus sp. CA047B]|uniref:hypothetical protein n=1 Tax=Corallococcus sp. CA047B TaxID=2316729 RepID=UPI000EA28E85|nr:hypothetical protein [Corallococcus sp. CA047B]RKH09000.1 hypothetical protein D7X74_30420 [Corallococcus sp. CA047B]